MIRWEPMLTFGGIAWLGIAWSGIASAEGTTRPSATNAGEHRWHGRISLGLNPVLANPERLPMAHLGFGASVSGFAQLSRHFSTGVAVDWERYTFDSRNQGDPANAPPRYTDEVVTYTRLMGLAQWEVWRQEMVQPFLLAAAGYGWESAELTGWQCSPELLSGPVLGAGGGVNFAVSERVGVGAEYRINTMPLPLSGSTCTLALIPDEPLGPPANELAQRASVTMSMRY